MRPAANPILPIYDAHASSGQRHHLPRRCGRAAQFGSSCPAGRTVVVTAHWTLGPHTSGKPNRPAKSSPRSGWVCIGSPAVSRLRTRASLPTASAGRHTARKCARCFSPRSKAHWRPIRAGTNGLVGHIAGGAKSRSASGIAISTPVLWYGVMRSAMSALARLWRTIPISVPRCRNRGTILSSAATQPFAQNRRNLTGSNQIGCIFGDYPVITFLRSDQQNRSFSDELSINYARFALNVWYVKFRRR